MSPVRVRHKTIGFVERVVLGAGTAVLVFLMEQVLQRRIKGGRRDPADVKH